MRKKKLRGERGASAVEFGLIVPILLILVLGIIEFGHAFQVQGTLSAAAREGARAMALQNDQGQARDAVQAAAAALNPGVSRRPDHDHARPHARPVPAWSTCS